MAIPIILASSSEQRKQLLSLIQIPVTTYVSPQVDESPLNGELPRDLALRLATLKADTVQQQYPNYIIIAADNVVACGRRILDKAFTDEDVRHHFNLLSGRKNTVYSALAMRHPSGKSSLKLVRTHVIFKRFTQKEIDFYVQTKEGIGKAAGYAIQGIASKYIRQIQGSYHGTVGLPVHEVYNVLTGWGEI